MSVDECPSPEFRLEALSERAVELALSPAVGWPRLVSSLARLEPDATVLDIAAAIAKAAMTLEEAQGVEEHRALALSLHRLAALAAIDAWAAGRRGWVDVRVGDLHLYRRLHGRLGAEEPR